MDDLQVRTWMEPLAAREIQILGLISDGLSNREISQKLFLTPETIKWYNKQIFRKLGVNNRTEAIKIAAEQGLLELDHTLGVEKAPYKLDNIPAQLTSFVGRAKEIAEIRQLLKANRLVVLTGAGGSGKTRLALQMANDLARNYQDGVWQVELGLVRDPNLVLAAIAKGLNIQLGANSPAIESLTHFLERKHLLLILDNFEHLLEASPWVTELLAAAPQLSVLATSRECLHVYGEQEYQVQPLNLPKTGTLETPKQLLAYEAVDLFVQRAQAVQPEFTLDENLSPAVVEICNRLDGLPLAIELAASQVKVFPPRLLAKHLESGTGFLASGPRDLPERQRTMQATIEWSYNLLKADEQDLFTRMAVFAGGGTLDSIQEICGQKDSTECIHLLFSLAEKNMLIPRLGLDGELRFTMLNTIHEFARQCLAASGEMEDILGAHAEYFTRLAESAEREIGSWMHGDWFNRFEAEQGNLNAALDWSLRGDQVAYGLRLVAALYEYWFANGYGSEVQRWTDLALVKSEQAAPRLRAGVLFSVGKVAYTLGDLAHCKKLLHQALDIYQGLGDERKTAWTMVHLSLNYIEQTSEYTQGKELCQQGLTILRKLGDQPGIARGLNILGELARLQGDDDAARRFYEDGLAIVKVTGERHREAILTTNLSFIASHEHDYVRARDLARQSIRVTRELNSLYTLGCGLMTLAGPVAALGDLDYAATLLGISHAINSALGIQTQPADQPEHDQIEASLRAQLGEEAFQEAFQAGQVMPIEEIIPFALKDPG